MNKKNAIFLSLLIFMYACNNENNVVNDNNNLNNDSVNNTVTGQKDSSSTSNICKSTVEGFLDWYNKNYQKIHSLQNSIVSLPESDTAQYRVNFANAENYVKALQGSSYFSDKFVAGKLQYFKTADENFVRHKQNDGPPEGFEYDLLLYTQEPESLLEKYKSLQTELVNPHLIKVKGIQNNLLFSVGEVQGKCLIDSIGVANR